ESGRGAGQAIRWYVWADGDAEGDVERKVDKPVFTTRQGYVVIPESSFESQVSFLFFHLLNLFIIASIMKGEITFLTRWII
ncbi:hypothetical protein, partial [Xenorhabdus szentirmaii]